MELFWESRLLFLSCPLQRWLKQHREEKERERLSNVAMETSDGVKASLTSDEHDKENLHTVPPGPSMSHHIHPVIVDSGRLTMSFLATWKFILFALFITVVHMAVYFSDTSNFLLVNCCWSLYQCYGWYSCRCSVWLIDLTYVSPTFLCFKEWRMVRLWPIKGSLYGTIHNGCLRTSKYVKAIVQLLKALASSVTHIWQ